jgi:hypothetical protein
MHSGCTLDPAVTKLTDAFLAPPMRPRGRFECMCCACCSVARSAAATSPHSAAALAGPWFATQHLCAGRQCGARPPKPPTWPPRDTPAAQQRSLGAPAACQASRASLAPARLGQH